MTAEWKKYTLGEVINLKRGYDLPNTHRKKGSVPIVSSSGIMDYHVEAMAKGPGVITGRYGTIGQVFYVTEDYWPLNTTLYVQDFKGNDQRFIYYLLTNFDFESYSDKSAVPGVNRNHLHTERVVIPQIEEQRAIASVLSSLDDKIDLLHRQNKTLEALAETLFRQWFVEEANENWKQSNLFDAIEMVGGGTPKTDVTENWNGNIKWISGKDTTQNHRQFITETEKSITPLGLERSATKVLPRYATVISARGTVGTYCILAEPMAFSQTSYGIKPRFNNCYFFTYLLIAHSVEELKAASYGSIFDTITTNTFREQSINLPPEPEVQIFEKTVEPYFTKMLLNQNQIHKLTQLRDTLLPKLMSGEVRIANSAGTLANYPKEFSGPTIYTIGHSNHSIEQFISMLKKHGIEVLADVRSTPYSRLHPQFNRDAIERSLRTASIKYVPLSKELGARPDDPAIYQNGMVRYERLAERPYFRNGIERLMQGRKDYRIAIMCAEKDPLNCHRTILVGHHLRNLQVPIKHILASGELEDNRTTEDRLVDLEGLKPTLFDANMDREERIQSAYEKRSHEIAYKQPEEEQQ